MYPHLYCTFFVSFHYSHHVFFDFVISGRSAHRLSSIKILHIYVQAAHPAWPLLIYQHQENVIWSGRHMQSSQTLRATSSVLLCTSRRSQTPLELSNVLSDSARAFSGASESTWSYEGAFRMLQDLTYRIVKSWIFWDLSADLRETSRAAQGGTSRSAQRETSRAAQRETSRAAQRETSRAAEIAAQHCMRLGAICSQQWFLHIPKELHLCYSHKIRYIILWNVQFKSPYIYTYGQSGRRWELSTIGEAPGHAHGENFGIGHLEAIVVKQRSKKAESTPSTLCHTPHDIQNKIHENGLFWFEEYRNRVRTYDTTWGWGSTQVRGATKSSTEWVRLKVANDRVCIFNLW